MSLRLHLGSIGGTTIEIDPLFFILIAFFVITDITGVASVPHALLWAPVLLISVLLHELAHAAVIALLGFGPSSVILSSMGGVTLNATGTRRPWQQVLISVAGPAASFAIAFVAAAAMGWFPGISHDPFFTAFVPMLSRANLFWGFFNLLPIGILDGGTLLHNLLRIFLPEKPAFVIAVWVSMLTGAGILLVGLYQRSFLLVMIMAMFIRTSYLQWTFFRAYRKPRDGGDDPKA